MSSPNVRIVPATDFAGAAAGRISARIAVALEERGHCAVALAGGSTPEPVYRELARGAGSARDGRLDWSSLRVYFGDERAVPPEDPRSNFRMARESLLDHVPVPRTQVHRIPAERPDLDEVAAAYGRQLPDSLDLLLLGIGEDGHVASLFPDSDALEEWRRRCVAVTGPEPPHRRVTITPPVIGRARSVVVLARGPSKARAVRVALEGELATKACPARLARRGTWILDREAGARLSGAEEVET